MNFFQEKRHNLSDPVATCGDRVYVIGSQNGLFADSWGGHVPHEMNGVWCHPIKLLDGYWFSIAPSDLAATHWLCEATACRAYPTYTEFDFRIGPLKITRRDFVPDGVAGLIVTLAIETDEVFPQPLQLTAHFRSDLRPVWLGERTGMVDGKDIVLTPRGTGVASSSPHEQGAAVLFTDALNPWVCVVEPDCIAQLVVGDDLLGPQRTHGNGASAQFVTQLTFAHGRARLSYFVAASTQSAADAVQILARLRTTHAELFEQKKKAYASLINTSCVTTPDDQINTALTWTKINAQWLARQPPASFLPRQGGGEGGRGCVGAGLPEYPWWFGIDTEYAVLPMLQGGQFELVRDTLGLLRHISEQHNHNEPGRIIHEMSTNGAVYNAGNAVESAAWVRAVHQYWQWSGDEAFLREQYPFCKTAVLDYLLTRCDPDRDLCPSGRSIIETLEMHAGVECIDVACYTCEALERLGDMAEFLGQPDDQARFENLFGRLRQRIQTEWWLEDEGLFADMRASKAELRVALQHLDATAQKLNRTAGTEDFYRQVQLAHDLLAPGFSQHKNMPDDADVHWLLRHWVVMCPVEVGIATPEQAARTLTRLQTSEFCSEWGMQLHPQRANVMSINTGLLALSMARAGAGWVDAALRLVRKQAEALSYRTPGAISEALPDQWCFVQLWSNLGVWSPVVECFLGIRPDAGRRKLRIAPRLPATWTHAKVQQLRVGEARIDVGVTRVENADEYAITLKGAEGLDVELAGARLQTA